jgi:hypothetical protein
MVILIQVSTICAILPSNFWRSTKRFGAFQAGCGGETIGLGLGRRPALGVCLAVVIYDLGSSLAI